MFTAELFTIVKNMGAMSTSINRGMGKENVVYIVEYYLAIKRNKIESVEPRVHMA